MPQFHEMYVHWIKLKGEIQVASALKDHAQFKVLQTKLKQFESINWYHPESVAVAWE